MRDWITHPKDFLNLEEIEWKACIEHLLKLELFIYTTNEINNVVCSKCKFFFKKNISNFLFFKRHNLKGLSASILRYAILVRKSLKAYKTYTSFNGIKCTLINKSFNLRNINDTSYDLGLI